MTLEEKQLTINQLKIDKECLNDGLISINARFNQNKKTLTSKIEEVAMLLKLID